MAEIVRSSYSFSAFFLSIADTQVIHPESAQSTVDIFVDYVDTTSGARDCLRLVDYCLSLSMRCRLLDLNARRCIEKMNLAIGEALSIFCLPDLISEMNVLCRHTICALQAPTEVGRERVIGKIAMDILYVVNSISRIGYWLEGHGIVQFSAQAMRRWFSLYYGSNVVADLSDFMGRCLVLHRMSAREGEVGLGVKKIYHALVLLQDASSLGCSLLALRGSSPSSPFLLALTPIWLFAKISSAYYETILARASHA